MKNRQIHHSDTDTLPSKKQRSYNDIIEFLNKNWKTNLSDTSFSNLTQLDKAFGSLSKKTPTILVAGTNGKSLTTGFTARLLREESLTVGTFISPHILTYNERFAINNNTIANKIFTDIANNVINTAESLDLTLNTFEVLTMMALIHFDKNNVDVAILETSENAIPKATSICNPSIVGITRIAENSSPTHNKASKKVIEKYLSIVQTQTHVISADQSKINLQTMQEIVETKGATWSMPIRKLVKLSYPFEQLHGRCASLAERIASIFINSFVNKDSVMVTQSLLTKIKGQRGRPTLEAKRRSEMNPKKTLDQFWKDMVNELPGRFQVLTKEKPTILLDNASNLDAIRNVLLGIRLLNYQRPLKGLCLIVGNNNATVDTLELLKLFRYFFKKTSGNIIICPAKPTHDNINASSWDTEYIATELKNMKVKARAAKNFKEAFKEATSLVDERHGLVVVTGSQEVVTEYWKNKGIKKI